MGDKLNPFQSLDDGTENPEPNSGYEDPVEKKKKKKAPARASRTAAPTNPFTEAPQASHPAPNPFITPSSQPTHPAPNPFTEPPSQSQPSWLANSKPTTSTYSSSSQPAYSNNKDTSLREADLLRREQALDARERELEAREAKLNKTISRIPNWPRWPKPFVHHDIHQEIPSDKRSLVRQAYIFWFVKFIFVIWNLAVVVGLLILDAKVGDLILAIFYLFIWNIILFLNYRLLYNACRRRRALSYVFFLFWFGLEILCYILWAVGIRGSGMAGVLWMIWCFHHSHHALGFMCLVNVIFCIIAAIFDCYIWIRTRSFYSVDGGTKAATKQAASATAEAAANNPEVAVNVASTVTPPFAATDRQTGY